MTGSRKESDQWRESQRQFIDAGRGGQVMKMDIDEIRALYGDKYDTHVKDMADSPRHNREFQAMLQVKGWTIDCGFPKRRAGTTRRRRRRAEDGPWIWYSTRRAESRRSCWA
ncbi:hypothetical protein OHT52_00360 [Streptomyces sp. NBC_00247]|uniref:hypothetical protein n=1 Tax=Streptomyces sp. NBC_00247 TaxID=2975689 RepID=UPI002E27B786|nr:hypothetical protein [Streptomyces sp. NBC_00247]